MNPRIEYNEEKNLLLKETRDVCFEDVIEAIIKGRILANLEHRDKKKHPNQKILAVKIKNYVYAVPYVVDKERKWIFFKTVYPSRILTKKYLRR